MKSMLLGAFIALLTCCRGYAEFHGYYFTPSDAGSSFGTTYKFHVEGMKGYVMSAELFVSPAARPIWNNNFLLWGSESTSPLLGDPSDRTTYRGRGYVPRDLLFNSYWGVDVTELMRSVKSPYVKIHISDARFTKDASLRVTTFVPEPSSLVLLAIGVGASLIGARRERSMNMQWEPGPGGNDPCPRGTIHECGWN
jgi:hypothetical protein